MSEDFETRSPEDLLPKGPQSALERRFIKEYLQNKGYQLEDLKDPPSQDFKQLMTEACQYAYLKLAEVESKAQFKKEIRGTSNQVLFA